MYTSSCRNAVNLLKLGALCTCRLYVEVYELQTVSEMKLQGVEPNS